MIFQSRHPLYLLLEAVLSGYLSYALVHWLRRKGGHSLVNALSLVSASFFGLGMVLKNAIQEMKSLQVFPSWIANLSIWTGSLYSAG